MERHMKKLRQMREKAMLGGGKEQIEKHRAQGKYTARERIEKLLDPGSFHETGMMAETICTDFGMDKKRFLGDGLVSGFGKIDGRRVSLFASDPTVLGGSGQSTHIRKIVESIDSAGKFGTPTTVAPDSALGVGDRGPEVRQLQERLNALGSELKVDGIFGLTTRAAVMAFQAQQGLAPDGVVGPKTRATLGL